MSLATLRRFVTSQSGSGFPHAFQGQNEGEFPFIKVSDFNHTGNERTITTCTNRVSLEAAKQLGARAVPPGSVLMPKVGAALLGNARRITSEPSLFDNNVLALVPHSIETRFLHYWLQTVDAGVLANPGPVPSLNDGPLLDLEVAVTDHVEQRAIADYLDTETARIDALITKKRRMIELLEERFVAELLASVSGAITSPKRQRVESDIEWLGALPEHYGTPWLGAHHQTQLGKMLNSNAAAGPEQYPYVKNTNVQWDQVVLEDLPTMSFDAADRSRCELRSGDVLVCEGGEVGRAAVWARDGSDIFFQKALHRVRPLGRASQPRFLMYCLWAAASQNCFEVEGNQATIVHLTGEKLREHRLPWPPLDEQDRIVKHLDSVRLTTHDAMSGLDEQLDLLSERRQALITAAVTGELRVPGVAA